MNGLLLRYDVDDRTFPSQLGLMTQLTADINAHVIQTQLNDNEYMRDRVHQVSLPSAAHRLENLSQRYSQVAEHTYGFSFCATATMQTDVDAINAYLNLIRDNPAQARTDPITWRWNHSIDNRVEFTVNGRVYSTHQVPGHPQLYPLNGVGVINGNGPVDMARILQGRGELGDNQKIKLYQVHCEREHIPCNQGNIGQLGLGTKAEYIAAMDALL